MDVVTQTLTIAVVLATPLLLAALGELVAERAGVLNLGVEGVMLLGAAVGVLVAVDTHSLVLAFVAGILTGTAAGAVHAFFAVTLGANQIVAGLTLVVLGSGLSAFLGAPVAGVPVGERMSPVAIPLLSDIPVIGPALFRQDVVVYLALIALPVVGVVLRRTRVGASLRACGSAPAAADAAGISVARVRWAAMLFAGAMGGFGGAYFAVAYTRIWTDDILAGRGWIALALVIFASWRPLALLPGAVLFGFLDALNFQLQTQGVGISADWLGMMPYAITLVALVLLGVRRRKQSSAGGPGALGVPYAREARA